MEGIIKYRCEWLKQECIVLTDEELERINYWRSSLKYKGLIGVLPDGNGYGNISIRHKDSNSFIITGSQTGHLDILGHNHFALVTDTSIGENSVRCCGMVKASSESLTHSVCYEVREDINAVIHIHSHKLWQEYLNKLPTTDMTALYGTTELAESLSGLIKIEETTGKGIVVMGGHPDGLLAFGFSLDDAGKKILTVY